MNTEQNSPAWLLPCRETKLLMGDERFWYSLDKMRAAFDVRELPGGWLVLKHDSKHGGWKYFAVLRFAQSETDGSKEFDELVFHGEGPGGKADESLRECRHTYWGEDGYIFYPNGKLITAALEALREFYDLD